MYSFLSSKPRQKLSSTQFKHLQQHYMTVHSIPSIHDPELINIAEDIDIWYRCRVDKTIYHCAQYQRMNSTPINHLVCVEQTVNANANYSYRVRSERMVLVKFYMYIQFYCVYVFRGVPQMLMYSTS